MSTHAQNYNFNWQTPADDTFKRFLQGILNAYHETAYPAMKVPQSKKFVLQVTDAQGIVVGGALFWAYWGWVDVTLVALQKEARGRGLGRRLMAAIEQKAREENCSRLRVECFGNEVGFYQKMGYRIVGQLDDYPVGHSYYWMRKDLQF
ncbi:MAG: GNAT family N-acetyltransferase [Anaerolineae bacterium]